MTPLDAVTWALIALGLYIGILAVKTVVYGATPYEALPRPDKMIYRYGQICIAAAVFLIMALTAAAVVQVSYDVFQLSTS